MKETKTNRHSAWEKIRVVAGHSFSARGMNDIEAYGWLPASILDSFNVEYDKSDFSAWHHFHGQYKNVNDSYPKERYYNIQSLELNENTRNLIKWFVEILKELGGKNKRFIARFENK